MELLTPDPKRTWCEYKGQAVYWNLGDRTVAWSFPKPSWGYEDLQDFLAFYSSRVDECWVDDERATAQEGDFYGGWITKNLRGPFKGGPGTSFW